MTIDVHAHFVPPSVIETLADRGAEFGIDLVDVQPGCQCCKFPSGMQIRPFFETLTNVDLRLADMDRQQIDQQVLTLWADIFGYELPADKGAAWHGVMNDCLARVCWKHSDRFSWMGSGPLQDAGLAARELERTMKEGAIGTMIAAHINGQNLGECDLDEFWAACVALDAPVFIHPVQPVAPPRAERYALNQIVAYTNDTTLTVGSLIFSGVLDRFPTLQLILSHGGGSVPFLIGRFDRMHHAADHNLTGVTAEHSPSDYLTRFHYDTILHYGSALRYLRDLVGVDRMVLGTDVPFPPGDPDALGSLRAAEFSEAEITKIAKTNPRRLFKALAG
ncbi:amidohydrolase [Alphaproteobacteria bacterium]|nr:amidohydrolase [Alphaproteobacteria bacterium]